MTSNELRNLYKERLKQEKQCYIAEVTGISPCTLSQFKNGRYDLYPDLHARLESYLLNN